VRSRLGALAAAFALVGLLPLPAAAFTGADLAAAQRRANAAAARLSRAQTALAGAEADVVAVQGRAMAAQGRLAHLVDGVRTTAVREYVEGGGLRLPPMFDGDIGEAVRADELLRFVTVGAADSIDRWRAARDDLRQTEGALRASNARQRSVVAALRREEAAAAAEVDRLARVQRAQAAQAARSSQSSRGGGRIVLGGGQGGWLCPVQGPRAFTDDFGAPRPGGRRHQGVDILSPRGTPVVASVAGVVSRNTNSLGGLAYFLHGADGITYYGAHLSAWAAQGQVVAGTVVGYVGNTGDAAGGATHLHFEMHPGGGAAVDPYPTLARHC
jgi:peptidoglycan LD-endopeptidase LytH